VDVSGLRIGAVVDIQHRMDMSETQMLVARVVGELGRRLAAEQWSPDLLDDDYASFVRRGGNDLAFHLGVDLPLGDSAIWLNPGLGVQHAELARLAGQFYRLEGGASQVGVSFADMRFRAGHQDSGLRWTVESPEDVDIAVNDVCADLAEFGMPFMARFSTLDDIIDALAGSPRSVFGDAHLAIAYALRGRMPEALEVMAHYTAVARCQPPFVAEQMNWFIDGFHTHFGTRNSNE
jgi:hypothetical protein